MSPEDLAGLHGTGIVYIAENDDSDGPRFLGHWETSFNGKTGVAEQGPGWDDPNEAVEWGRERASHVVVRTGTSFADTKYFSAGVEDIEGSTDEPVRRWEEG